jgi:hypothetical protein
VVDEHRRQTSLDDLQLVREAVQITGRVRLPDVMVEDVVCEPGVQ